MSVTKKSLLSFLAVGVKYRSVSCGVCLFDGCLTSQQHAGVSRGRICTDTFTCCHTEIEVTDQTFYLTQSHYTDTGPTSASADLIMPGSWQGSHWSAKFEVTGMTRPRKNPGESEIRTRNLPFPSSSSSSMINSQQINRSSVRLMPQNQPSGRGLLPSPTAWSSDQHPAAMLADVSRHTLGRAEGRGLGFGQLVRTHTGKCLKCQSSSDGHSDHNALCAGGR